MGRSMWRMRWAVRWVSTQCDYSPGREIDCRKFCSISLQKPSHHNSEHCTIVAKIYSGDEKKVEGLPTAHHCFLIKLPWGPQGEIETLFEELCMDVAPPLEKERPKNQ
jgi:hypothetical protein